MNNVKVVYYDTAVGASIDFAPTSNNTETFASGSKLNNEGLVFENYSTVGEFNQTILNKSQQKFTDNPETANFGLWTNILSTSTGEFTVAPQLTVISTRLYETQGFSFSFDIDNNIYPRNINIKWYNDTTLVAEQNFSCNAPYYFCEKQVSGFNKAIITFQNLNMPYNRLKIREIQYGTVRIFLDDEIEQGKVTKHLNPASIELQISSFDFNLASKTNVQFAFEKKQQLMLYCNGNLDGVFFVDEYKRTAENRYQLETQDYIGLMDNVTFLGGMYTNANAKTVLTEIFNLCIIPFELSSELESKTITGYIPICSCREALLQIAFSIGAVINTSKSNKVLIYSLSNEIKREISANESMLGQSVSSSTKMTEFQLTQHAYLTSTESITAYSSNESGTGTNIYVEFSEPLHTLNITNGTIVSSGVNYAIINANTACILTGQKYTHTTSIKSIKNENVLTRDLPNIIKMEDCTLINSQNIEQISNICYNYLLKNTVVETEIKLYNSDVGDTVSLETDFLGTKTGIIETLKYSVGSKVIIAESEVR